MMSEPPKKDLIALVADRNMEFALNGILLRPESLGTRGIAFEVVRHPEHDPGCFLDGPDFLRFYVDLANYALIIMDFEGTGQEARMTCNEMQQQLEARLDKAGWKDRAAAIVVEPELENWVWSDSPHVVEILGWFGRTPTLRDWLLQQGMWDAGAKKPPRPKEALEAAIYTVRKPRSSAVYQAIARTVSFDRCTDPAFIKLRRQLTRWFPKVDEIPGRR